MTSVTKYVNRQGREKWRNRKGKGRKRGSNPFSLASSILERNATECFATRNVAGAGTGSSFSRVLDPWKTAIKRFISTPLLRASTFLPSFLPSFLLPTFHLSFLVVEIHACDVFLPSSFPRFIHLSLSLFLYEIPFTPVRCLHRPGLRHVYFPRRGNLQVSWITSATAWWTDNLLVHKDDVSKRTREMFREGMQIRTKC